MPLFERMVIAGVGLIGGSLGLAARKRALVREVVGFGRGVENLEIALRRGAIDRFSRSAPDAARDADLIVLAVPVRSIRAVAASLLPSAARDVIVIDVGSVKGEVVAALEPIVDPPAAFVGCHPIAGTEHSGAAHAEADLLSGARCIVTPTAATDRAALERIEKLWTEVGMRVESMPPEDHDRLLALVSHLPHVVAYSLISAIESERIAERDPLEYSGGGLRDTTRIASSHPEMWRDIFLENRQELLRTITGFEAALQRIRRMIEAGDETALESELARIKSARGRLKDKR